MLLKELTQAFGVSGYEGEVRNIIKAAVRDYADDIITDALGNLIVFKKGTAENRKKIMMAAHMDEIGLQVTKIDERGFIKFKGLGYSFPSTLFMSRVKFRNGITGLVTSVMEEAKYELTKMHIDIGAQSREDALKYIKIGDIAGYIGEYCELQNNIFTAKALDNRLGCYILIEALKKTGAPQNDLYFVFTVQEELGCRGAKIAAERIKPDLGISMDITPAHDYPCDLEGSNTLGAGTAIKVSDPSVICDEYLVDEMVKCCEENKIKYQHDVIYAGGTDASSINTSNFGVRVAGVSVALRYPHGHSAFGSMKDVEASIELISKYVNRNFHFESWTQRCQN